MIKLYKISEYDISVKSKTHLKWSSKDFEDEFNTNLDQNPYEEIYFTKLDSALKSFKSIPVCAANRYTQNGLEWICFDVVVLEEIELDLDKLPFTISDLNTVRSITISRYIFSDSIKNINTIDFKVSEGEE